MLFCLFFIFLTSLSSNSFFTFFLVFTVGPVQCHAAKGLASRGHAPATCENTWSMWLGSGVSWLVWRRWIWTQHTKHHRLRDWPPCLPARCCGWKHLNTVLKTTYRKYFKTYFLRYFLGQVCLNRYFFREMFVWNTLNVFVFQNVSILSEVQEYSDEISVLKAQITNRNREVARVIRSSDLPKVFGEGNHLVEFSACWAAQGQIIAGVTRKGGQTPAG